MWGRQNCSDICSGGTYTTKVVCTNVSNFGVFLRIRGRIIIGKRGNGKGEETCSSVFNRGHNVPNNVGSASLNKHRVIVGCPQWTQ